MIFLLLIVPNQFIIAKIQQNSQIIYDFVDRRYLEKTDRIIAIPREILLF